MKIRRWMSRSHEAGFDQFPVVRNLESVIDLTDFDDRHADLHPRWSDAEP
jgi:hypothetical protein